MLVNFIIDVNSRIVVMVGCRQPSLTTAWDLRHFIFKIKNNKIRNINIYYKYPNQPPVQCNVHSLPPPPLLWKEGSPRSASRYLGSIWIGNRLNSGKSTVQSSLKWAGTQMAGADLRGWRTHLNRHKLSLFVDEEIYINSSGWFGDWNFLFGKPTPFHALLAGSALGFGSLSAVSLWWLISGCNRWVTNRATSYKWRRRKDSS
jgi:hypothetical protein